MTDCHPLFASHETTVSPAAIFCTAVLVASLWGLKALPYTTSWIVGAPPEKLASPPSEAPLAADVRFAFQEYREARSLEPFRKRFRELCDGKVGLEAARCFAQALAAKSPMGNPEHEFVDPEFNPSISLETQLAGHAGHCTSRSALTATALLSMGMPARVVQVFGASELGHNILEVWDAGAGNWIAYDGLLDLVTTADGRMKSLAEVVGGPTTRVQVHGLGAFEMQTRPSAVSVVLYPEPWLYTRVGERAAPFPFRGTFLRVGEARLLLGPLQQGLRLAAGLAGLSLLVFAVQSLFSRRARKTPGLGGG